MIEILTKITLNQLGTHSRIETDIMAERRSLTLYQTTVNTHYNKNVILNQFINWDQEPLYCYNDCLIYWPIFLFKLHSIMSI